MTHQNIVHKKQCGYHPAVPYNLDRHSEMKVEELRRAMRSLGTFSHQQLADLIGVSRPTVTLWLQGRQAVPKPVAMLIRLLLIEKERSKTT